MSETTIRRTVRVRGTVQGVGFRYYSAERARPLGVTGSVRNLADGSVEADVEGDREAVETMLAWLRQGPPAARVTDVDVHEAAPSGTASFEILS